MCKARTALWRSRGQVALKSRLEFIMPFQAAHHSCPCFGVRARFFGLCRLRLKSRLLSPAPLLDMRLAARPHASGSTDKSRVCHGPDLIKRQLVNLAVDNSVFVLPY